MSECKVVSIPLDQNLKLYNDDRSKATDGTLYRQLVGSFNYLTTTILDISYSVSILSQFMAKPCDTKWKATKIVLRYLKGIINFGILISSCQVILILIGKEILNTGGIPQDMHFVLVEGSFHGETRNIQLFLYLPQMQI